MLLTGLITHGELYKMKCAYILPRKCQTSNIAGCPKFGAESRTEIDTGLLPQEVKGLRSLFSLENKVAIVTGASRWTGKTIALEMAKAGADIVVCARTPDLVEATAAEIRSLGRKSLAVPTDVRVAEQVNNMVKKTLQEFGRVDILVNSAGASFAAHAMKLNEDGWDAIVRENMKPVFICSKAVVESMVEHGGGSIINISCAAAQEVFSKIIQPDGTRRVTGSAFGASKAALERLTVGLAEEVREYNIAVNAIKPAGVVNTEGMRLWMPDADKSHWAPPDRMVKAVTFLAGQDASGVTGTVVSDEELCTWHGL